MSFGKNLSYLRRLGKGMTQEALAERMNVTRQTVSKWEMDASLPEIEKAIELCGIFGVTLDKLFREDLCGCNEGYTDLRTEVLPAFRYVKYAVISTDPEGDAIGHIRAEAKKRGVDDPRIVGWDFPVLNPEQVNVYHMHGYVAAWILPDGTIPEDMEVCEQAKHRYAAIHIKDPFLTPFTTIPNAYRTLIDYMRINGLEHCEKDVIPCFETAGEEMDIYIAYE